MISNITFHTCIDIVLVMAPVYGWKASGAKDGDKAPAVYISSQGDKITEDINNRLKKNFLRTLCQRPSEGVTEVCTIEKDKLIIVSR